jgi:hypothetical protein
MALISRSGGAYIYYWPRNSANVPDNVKVSLQRMSSVRVSLIHRTPVMARWTLHPGANHPLISPSQLVRMTLTTTLSSSTLPSAVTSESSSISTQRSSFKRNTYLHFKRMSRKLYLIRHEQSNSIRRDVLVHKLFENLQRIW